MRSDVQTYTPSKTAQDCPQSILARKARPRSSYLCEPLEGVINGKNDLLMGANVDTEYYQPNFPTLLERNVTVGRRGVTVQVSGIHGQIPVIFVHPHQVEYAKETSRPIRHPVFQTGFAPIDYLQYLGYDVSIERYDRVEAENLPRLQIVTYAHFAIAELYMIVQGDFITDVRDGLLDGSILMERRLRTRNDLNPQKAKDYCPMAWRVTLEGYHYGLDWCNIDTGAIHGNISYKDFCANTGIHLSNKDVMKERGWIENMHETYFEHPTEFDEYAIGDLQIYPALAANDENFKRLWGSLNLQPYYHGTKLTIGATIQHLFRDKILQLFDIAPDNAKARDECLNDYCLPASAESLGKRTDRTACLLAKVEGGRCWSNQPTVVSLTGTLVDHDLKSCYGEGQRNQLYPFGRPFIFDFPLNSPGNDYPTLREFMKVMKWGKKDCELVPGLWHARVALAPNTVLEHAQDYLGSWFGYSIKDISEKPFDPRIENLDSVLEELDVHTGQLKILSNDIQHSVITHDFLQWIEHVVSPVQRNELLDKLYIHAALIYPASQRVNSIAELQEARANHQGKNLCIMRMEKGLLTKISKDQECYNWYAVNLGEFVIDELLANRFLHPKETPLNTMYKLAVNTLYGDTVSPYFVTSNVTVANNITARARAACWYMEKGLNTIQSITDGGVFDINRVVYPTTDKPVTAKRLHGLYQLQTVRERETSRNIRFAPLGGYDHIELEYDHGVHDDIQWKYGYPILHCYAGDTIITLRGKEALLWIDRKTMIHLQKLFPNVDVLHASSTRLQVSNDNGALNISHVPRIGQFEFESKAVFKSGTFHGAANYRLVGANKPKIAMRAYERKRHYTTRLQHDKIVLGNRYDKRSPQEVFLTSLESPEPIARASVFVKDGILKPKEYVARYNSRYENSLLNPGDNIHTAGLLREFSPAQFSFCTVDQYKAIERQYNRCKNHYSQYVEAYFLTDDGRLDYRRMIQVVDELISSGSMDLLGDLDKHNHVYRSRPNRRNHREFWTFNGTRSHIERIQGTPVKSRPTQDQ